MAGREHAKTNQVLKTSLKSNFTFKVRQISKEKMIQRIVNNTIFGFVECHVPEHLNENFNDFTPVF